MELSDLQKNQKAVIKKINSTTELKQRFYSFGITKDAHIEVENVSLARNTIEINVESTSIGLRVEEAKAIEVEVI
ncbi:MAG: FeoA family protein [Campylobacterota bacterium]|nr:FeoA family protein [Campylobacterota bacterium]